MYGGENGYEKEKERGGTTERRDKERKEPWKKWRYGGEKGKKQGERRIEEIEERITGYLKGEGKCEAYVMYRNSPKKMPPRVKENIKPWEEENTTDDVHINAEERENIDAEKK